MSELQRSHAYATPRPAALTGNTALAALATLLGAWVVLYAAPAYASFFGDLAKATGGCGSFIIAVCPTSLEDGIFTYFVCNMEKLIGEVFGKFYCALAIQVKGPLTAAMTLAVITFGVAFTIGVIQATAKDFMLFLLKAAAIWAFATSPELLVGVVYNFFVGGLKQGIGLVTNAIFFDANNLLSYVGGTTFGGQEVYRYMDEVFNRFAGFASESVGAEAGDADYCKNAIFAALVLFAIAFPPLFAIGVFLVIKFVLFFLRAVFGYIYALLGITFLILLAPIFLPFAFWRQTKQYFDKWIGHLAAFALQMIIVFAFIALILSMNVSSIARDLMDLIVPYNKSTESSGITWPWEVCTICEFNVVDGDGAIVTGGDLPPGGTAKCTTDPGTPIDPAALMGPAEAETRDTLLKLASKVILTLLVLVYVVNALLDVIPNMARMIASAGSILSPNLTGTSDQGRPVNQLPGEKAFGSFQQAFEGRLAEGGNPITAYSEAFTNASRAMLTGRDANGNVTYQGLSQNLMDWLGNPVN